MIIRNVWPLALVTAVAANAAALPLNPGTYVLAGTACHEPPFAAMFDYDGRQFSYPHATHCRSVIRARKGATYNVSETCSAIGDGSPTKPVTRSTSYTIVSKTVVRVKTGQTSGASTYRWCSALGGKASS